MLRCKMMWMKTVWHALCHNYHYRLDMVLVHMYTVIHGQEKIKCWQWTTPQMSARPVNGYISSHLLPSKVIWREFLCRNDQLRCLWSNKITCLKQSFDLQCCDIYSHSGFHDQTSNCEIIRVAYLTLKKMNGLFT